jgi:hypothetical protein
LTGKFKGHNPFSGEKGYVPNFPDRGSEFPGQESRKYSTVSLTAKRLCPPAANAFLKSGADTDIKKAGGKRKGARA